MKTGTMKLLPNAIQPHAEKIINNLAQAKASTTISETGDSTIPAQPQTHGSGTTTTPSTWDTFSGVFKYTFVETLQQPEGDTARILWLPVTVPYGLARALYHGVSECLD